ncbi:MAG: sulfatase-like hydrolase/transferase [Armatimonadota bacterium]
MAPNSKPAKAPRRPNILVLMTDQHRFNALRCAGNQKIRTPNLDALAASGVHFTNACCATPVCVASRMSLITGQRMARHHWTANAALPGPLPELPTLMTLLHRAGYQTHAVGKMHFRGRHYGLETHERMEEGVRARIDDDYLMDLKEHGVRTRHPQGLRDLLYCQPQTVGIAEEHSQNAWVAQRSIEFLRRHTRYRGGKPFLLWASWTAPHPPYAPCEPYDSLYDPGEMDLPINAERPLASIPSAAWAHRARLDGAHLDPDRMRRIRALYYGQVSHVDEAAGRILGELETLGLSDNTVILFTSDHGDMLGDHGLSQKNVPYELSVRVPMLLRWPGRTEAGRVCDDLVGLTDVLPTLTEGLGLPYPDAPAPLPGSGLLGQEGGGLSSEREAFFIDYGHGPNRWIALRTRKHKYALWADSGCEELYDLEADPRECTNLRESEPKLTAKLRATVLAWEREHGLPGSFDGEQFRTYPGKPLPDGLPRRVVVNEGPWVSNLPEDERHTVETYAEAFTRAISKETSLSPEKLSLALYKRKGGTPLIGTPWEKAWRDA